MRDVYPMRHSTLGKLIAHEVFFPLSQQWAFCVCPDPRTRPMRFSCNSETTHHVTHEHRHAFLSAASLPVLPGTRLEREHEIAISKVVPNCISNEVLEEKL
eukprot:2749075-Amphidinium_carterae.1